MANLRKAGHAVKRGSAFAGTSKMPKNSSGHIMKQMCNCSCLLCKAHPLLLTPSEKDPSSSETLQLNRPAKAAIANSPYQQIL